MKQVTHDRQHMIFSENIDHLNFEMQENKADMAQVKMIVDRLGRDFMALQAQRRTAESLHKRLDAHGQSLNNLWVRVQDNLNETLERSDDLEARADELDQDLAEAFQLITVEMVKALDILDEIAEKPEPTGYERMSAPAVDEALEEFYADLTKEIIAQEQSDDDKCIEATCDCAKCETFDLDRFEKALHHSLSRNGITQYMQFSGPTSIAITIHPSEEIEHAKEVVMDFVLGWVEQYGADCGIPTISIFPAAKAA